MGSLAAVLMAVKVARAKISYILITELGFLGKINCWKFEVVSLIECLFGELWNSFRNPIFKVCIYFFFLIN